MKREFSNIHILIFFSQPFIQIFEYINNFLTRKFRRDREWKQPDDYEELSGFTYESAVKWITYAKEHMRIRCEDDETKKVISLISNPNRNDFLGSK